MDIINKLANYLNTPTGDFWGFLGIAVTYLTTGIIEWPNERQNRIKTLMWFVPSVIFIFGAFAALKLGTVKVVDTGKVLGYLGIGTGLFCTAYTVHADRRTEVLKWIFAWFSMIAGVLFVLAGAILNMPSGIINPFGLLFIVLLVIIFYTVFKLVKDVSDLY